MKHVLCPIILMLALCCGYMSASESGDDPFKGWTDEQIQRYDDSIKARLYAPVYARKFDPDVDEMPQSEGPMRAPSATANTHVPTTVTINKSYAVGEIPIESGTTQSGARTYTVPITVYPGIRQFHPNLALNYNSQQGPSYIAVGWTISGIPAITRSGKSQYYDSKSEGVVMNNTDAFLLDGMRLIKTAGYSDYQLYESEQGNIKVKGYISGNVMRYFEVFYPDGNKGVFGYTSRYSNMVQYPLTKLTDMHGNAIEYSYVSTGNQYCISSISYNGASVEFTYTTRSDPSFIYSGGIKIENTRQLQKITCKLGAAVLGTYTLSYVYQNLSTLLSSISYTAGSKSFNPLRFYYGTGNVASVYTTSVNQLLEWYESNDPAMIKVEQGKFDYSSGLDGLIALPNKNPYWKYYRKGGTFRHTRDRFENNFDGKEKIFLYAGLADNLASPMPNLLTEEGFVDILCADFAGKQEECIIKVNNKVVDKKDQLTFTVYGYNSIAGIAKRYSRTYNFETVYTDRDGYSSIHPKFYYTGDFNGDGKMEILAVSVSQPFPDKDRPSVCHLFDLENNKVLFQKHVFPYVMEFVGNVQTDPKAAANNTDKLIALDYDGDGKTDICHINDNGVNIYTFDITGTTYSMRKVATYTGLKKSGLNDRHLLVGDFNGDGLMDLLVSPVVSAAGGSSWYVYHSTGMGQFVATQFNNVSSPTADYSGFLIQDINGDGCSDLIKYDRASFYTYLSEAGLTNRYGCYQTYPSGNSVIVPVNINSSSSFTQLASIYKGKVTKYKFSRDDNMSVMSTGMANSLGVIERTDYKMTVPSSGIFTKGSGAAFPYVNIQEPMGVVATTETLMNGSVIDRDQYFYTNAVFHKQGRGFCGFGKIIRVDNRGRNYTMTYEPASFGVLRNETTPEYSKDYVYSNTVSTNKIAKIRLSTEIENNTLYGASISTTYTYDTYGYPKVESTSYYGGISKKVQNTYASNATVGDGYHLGCITDRTVTTSRNGSSVSTREVSPSMDKLLPLLSLSFVDGSQTEQCKYTRDNNGNITSKLVTPYSGNEAEYKYEYDSYGRLTKETDDKGFSTTYTYNSIGKIASITDHRGGTTAISYDDFGREQNITYPDNTSRKITYAWTTDVTNGLYSISKSLTGTPDSVTVYDPLNREVRVTSTNFDGVKAHMDKSYDNEGNLLKVSYPYTGASASRWLIYGYDYYNRLISMTDNAIRNTTYSYKGLKVTTVANGVTTTKTYDILGNLLSVTDPSGTVTYNLEGDGQPSSIVAPDDVTTTFGYDKYRRLSSMDDSAHGAISYGYDAGGNIKSVTDARGNTVEREYDSYNRLSSVLTPEFSTSYIYNNVGDLTDIITDNGTSKSYTYDDYGRVSTLKESAVDGIWLKKEYSYLRGNIGTIVYSSSESAGSEPMATETYDYANGHLKGLKLNGISIFKLVNQGALGEPTMVNTGSLRRRYGYNQFNQLVHTDVSNGNSAFLAVNYSITPANWNLTNRHRLTSNFSEDFEYDNLNRLTSYSGNTVTYDAKGNILTKSDVGIFKYDIPGMPYALSEAEFTDTSLPTHQLDIAYTSFGRPSTIDGNGYAAEFTYNANGDRVKMTLCKDGAEQLSRHYIGGCYELDRTAGRSVERLYLMGGYYKAPVVLVKENGKKDILNIMRDNLGSIIAVTDTAGVMLQQMHFDPWGRMVDPVTRKVYEPGKEPELISGRGFTGHEHLAQFGLINMNARLYDPVPGRFLSPDPMVQDPELPLNYNRYTYALNNPLRYTDPNGEFFLSVIISAAFDLFKNIFTRGVNVNHYSWRRTTNAWKIEMGMYKGNAWQVINKKTWGAFNSLVGNTTAHWLNLSGEVMSVSNKGGMLAISGITNKTGKAFTIGHLSFGPDDYKAGWDNHLFVHEYGHYIQSQILGPSYIKIIGIPSLISAWGVLSDINHDKRWFEVSASRLGANYVGKKDKDFNRKKFNENNPIHNVKYTFWDVLPYFFF